MKPKPIIMMIDDNGDWAPVELTEAEIEKVANRVANRSPNRAARRANLRANRRALKGGKR